MKDVIARLRAELARTGMTQSELARAIGLEPDKMSKIMNGHRKLQLAELEAITRALTPQPAPLASPPGMAESTARWEGPGDGRSAGQVAAALFPRARRPESVEFSLDDAAFGVRRGDVVFFDMGRAPSPGDLVLVQEDGDNGEGQTRLGRWHSPHIITRTAVETGRAPRDDDQSTRALYPVLGLLRLSRP